MYQRRLLCRVALVIPALVILPQITETSVMPGGDCGPGTGLRAFYMEQSQLWKTLVA